MRNIELTINDNGYIICTLKKNDKISYISYKDIINYINELSTLKKELSIINGDIEFKVGTDIVIIRKYKNNKDINLERIIERLTIEKINERKKYLKNKRVSRNKRLTCTILLAGVISVSSLFSNFIDATPLNYKDFKIKNYSIERLEHKSNNKDIVYANEGKNEIIEKEYESEKIEQQSNIRENEQEVIKNSNEDIKNCILEVSYENRTETEKFQITKAYYKDIIAKISLEYGIDPQVMLAIATQESGIHDINRNGAAIGLMQIEKSVWNNQTLTAYNYSTNKEETIIITEEKLKDLEFNIRTSCMIFQQCLKNSNYNLSVAIQMYNFGYGNILNTFKICYGNNMDFEEKTTINDNSWLDFREDISEGDKEYLEHILSYIENPEEIYYKINETTINYQVKNKILNIKI